MNDDSRQPATPAQAPVSQTFWRTPLALIGLAAALTALSLIAQGTVSAALCIPLAITLPGLALLSMSLDSLQLRSYLMALGLAVVVSAAFYIVVALALDTADLPLSRSSFLVAVDGLVLLAAIWNLVVSRETVPPVPFGADWRALAVPLLSVIAAGGIVAVMAVQRDDPSAPYHALYPAGPAGRGEAVPITDGRATIPLVVENVGDSERQYRLTATVPAGQRWRGREIVVAPDEVWHGSLSGPIGETGGCRRVQVQLEQPGSARPITQLTVWLDGRTACR